MKKDTLLIIAAAAAGLWFIARTAKAMGTSAAPTATGANRAAAVTDSSLYKSPNAGMSLTDQYKEYGYGQSVADVYSNTGYLGQIN